MSKVIDIKPYWPKIVDYYWKELHTTDRSIWDWMASDYSGIKAFGLFKENRPMWVRFNDEGKLTMFLLRWA